MEIAKIVQCNEVAVEKVRRKQEMAEEALAVVVTQTFDYMVDQGLSYGYANGGNTFVFILYHPDGPQTVY